jgi:LPXTG-motif cell wall-anchored protein
MEHGFLISWLPVFVFFILSFCSVFGFIFLSGLFTDDSIPPEKSRTGGSFQYIVNNKIFRNVSRPLIIMILFCSVIYLIPWPLVVNGETSGRGALLAGLLFMLSLALGYLYTRRRQSGTDHPEDSVE